MMGSATVERGVTALEQSWALRGWLKGRWKSSKRAEGKQLSTQHLSPEQSPCDFKFLAAVPNSHGDVLGLDPPSKRIPGKQLSRHQTMQWEEDKGRYRYSEVKAHGVKDVLNLKLLNFSKPAT